MKKDKIYIFFTRPDFLHWNGGRPTMRSITLFYRYPICSLLGIQDNTYEYIPSRRLQPWAIPPQPTFNPLKRERLGFSQCGHTARPEPNGSVRDLNCASSPLVSSWRHSLRIMEPFMTTPPIFCISLAPTTFIYREVRLTHASMTITRWKTGKIPTFP